MADSTISDFSKMKVVELRKELKTRGLPHNGDKSELIARLQAAARQDETGDITLDSDEIDSDAVLEEEDEKNQTEITLDEAAVNDTLNEELVLAEPSSVSEPPAQPRPMRILKRKLTSTTEPTTTTKILSETKETENKEHKKITLNRAISVTSHSETDEPQVEATKNSPESNKVKITSEVDPKAKLEMRAKRFGLPIKMTESERKQARQIRFGQGPTTTGNTPAALADNIDKLKKRAERFGQSVSKVMTDLENRERLEKRKAKFGSAN